ncbi:hypothetical protein [Propioniciclava sp.]|uniref:hypothetical protein n=1 Tax=Propioniciclava sp. TaxID=2038686 RepID=UPI00260D6251|nr:hypothetical protein [Propioniciclava sp.]
MDDWTYDVDADVPDTQPPLLHEDGRAMEARRARAQQAEAARVAELQQTQAFDAAGSPAEADLPLPFATPPGAALTF